MRGGEYKDDRLQQLLLRRWYMGLHLERVYRWSRADRKCSRCVQKVKAPMIDKNFHVQRVDDFTFLALMFIFPLLSIRPPISMIVLLCLNIKKKKKQWKKANWVSFNILAITGADPGPTHLCKKAGLDTYDKYYCGAGRTIDGVKYGPSRHGCIQSGIYKGW